MKVIVHPSFNSFHLNSKGRTIDNVVKVDKSKAGGYLIVTEDKTYCLPKDVLLIIEGHR